MSYEGTISDVVKVVEVVGASIMVLGGLGVFLVFVPLLLVCVAAEQSGNPAPRTLGIDQAASALSSGGNMEGKEVRFGIVNSALFATTTFVIFHFGLDRDRLEGELAAGVLWVTLLFAAILGINRLFVAEREQGGFDGILMAPIERTSLLVAKAAALFAYLLALELIALPVFALFFLGEYVSTVTVAAVAVTLFLGGWRGPHPDFLAWLWPLLWFLAKVTLVIYVYIWVRGTLPRVRYDRLMQFGWKVLIPFGLVWVMVTGAVVVLPDLFGSKSVFLIAAGVLGAIALASMLAPLFSRAAIREVRS